MKRVVYFVCLLAASWLLVPSGTTWAQSDTESGWNPGPNVQLTLRTVDSEPGARPDERVHTFVARDRGGVARMLMGWRVPIPKSRDLDDGDSDPVTEYVYQNIGFTAELEVVILEDGRILVHGQIEASGVRTGPEAMRKTAGEELPIIGTFQQDLSVILKEGKPLRVAEVPDPEGGRVHLEIQADVLD